MRLVVQCCASILLFTSVGAVAQEHLFPAKYVDLDGGHIAYREAGDPEGEAILFAHGSVMADSFLRLLSEPSLANYRLISYHRRGYGESSDFDGTPTRELQTRDALTLLAQLEVEGVHVVGHSQGGMIAVQLASAAPELVHSVMLLEGAMPLVEGRGRIEIIRERAGEEAVAAYLEGERQRDLLIERERQGYEFDLAISAEGAMEALRSWGGENWREDLLPHIPGVLEQMTKDWIFSRGRDRQWGDERVTADFYTRIQQPTVQVVSEYQPGFVRDFPQSTWSVLPHAQLRYLSDMGHEMMMMHPTPVAELISNWVAEHSIK